MFPFSNVHPLAPLPCSSVANTQPSLLYLEVNAVFLFYFKTSSAIALNKVFFFTISASVRFMFSFFFLFIFFPFLKFFGMTLINKITQVRCKIPPHIICNCIMRSPNRVKSLSFTSYSPFTPFHSPHIPPSGNQSLHSCWCPCIFSPFFLFCSIPPLS